MRNDLGLDEILETLGETWEDFKEKQQQEFLEKLGFRIPFEIERAYRMLGIQNNTNNGSNPRATLCNLLRCKDKMKILQKSNNLKGTNIFIN